MGHRISPRHLTWWHLGSVQGAAKWQNTHEATQDVVTAIQEVRTCAKASQALPKITLKDLDDALATMSEATGMGAGRFKPYLKPVERYVQTLSTNAKRKSLGPGRYLLHWYACLPMRSNENGPSPY